MFKSVIAGNQTIEISERTKSILPDFPKVAISYSISENEQSSIHNQEKMKEALEDYNRTYKTKYTLETIKAYNQNINERLSRKREKYHERSEQIDIIIVVDRLLTGFDAPCISTLFIDRPVMSPQNIIQAFSRTNRLFDRDKTYGQIVIFQTPSIYKKAIEKALILYSNGGENYVLAPVWEETKAHLIEAVNALRKIAPAVGGIKELSIGEKRQFVKAFQQLDKALSSASVYFEFNQENLDSEFSITETEIEFYHGEYVNVLEELRASHNDNEGEVELIDIEYVLHTHRMEEINYHYILSLIQQFLPKEASEPFPQSEKNIEDEEIDNYIETLKKENPKLSEVMSPLWEKIKQDPDAYCGQNITELLDQMIAKTIAHLVDNFSKIWALQSDKLRFVVDNYNPNQTNQNGEDELRNTSDYNVYKENTENPVSKLRYWRSIKQAYTEMIQKDVLPLRMK